MDPQNCPSPELSLRTHDASAPASATSPDWEITLGELFRVLWARRWHIVALSFVGGVLLAFYAFTQPRTYTTVASFTPQSSTGGASRLAGLASQFGLGMLSGQPGRSPAFFADLLRSRQLLGEAVDTRYSVRVDSIPREATLSELWDIDAPSEPLRREAAIDRLRGAVTATVGRETGLVRFTVMAESAELSGQIAERLLSLINEFNLRTRRQEAEAEREFTRERLTEARADLEAAEERVRSFLRSNRNYSAPDLQSEHDRLTREASMQRELYTGLAQALAQARLDASRNTPVITVVEQPMPPARPDSRRVALHAVIGAIATGSLVALAVLALSLRSRRPAAAARGTLPTPR